MLAYSSFSIFFYHPSYTCFLVRSVYTTWCGLYEKEVDESRFPTFSSNYVSMKTIASENDDTMMLNKWYDLTEVEYLAASNANIDIDQVEFTEDEVKKATVAHLMVMMNPKVEEEEKQMLQKVTIDQTPSTQPTGKSEAGKHCVPESFNIIRNFSHFPLISCT